MSEPWILEYNQHYQRSFIKRKTNYVNMEGGLWRLSPPWIVYVVIFTSNTYIVLHHFDNCLSPPCKKMNLEWANSVIVCQ